MSIKRTLERNRQMKRIAQSVQQKWLKATVYSIDGDRANIRLGASPNLIRHVEVAGDVNSLLPMSEVPIVWKDNRPVVLASGAAQLANAAGAPAAGSSVACARVIRTSNQAATGSVNTLAVITFDSAIFDTVGMWDSAQPTRLTILESGFYIISASVQTGTGSAAMVSAAIRLNGDTDLAAARSYTSSTAAASAVSPSGVVWLDAGDYLELFVGGGNVTAHVDQSSPILSVGKIG